MSRNNSLPTRLEISLKQTLSYQIGACYSVKPTEVISMLLLLFFAANGTATVG
jgi:hypothetical protein